ncbi:DNA topoisomerase I [Pyrococcus yayanosii]|uniref:DNA topoisomerase 1 n=1 Tax=Pyrococcus yayanosii (strain CH1 / JCM 16557) TaxID=529709 RepID=F8AHG4_PYRYC|nr:DNA topoisomerase I [Pyrococcus yayanosii]AEH24162.1 DNA topoisomerase I [Pyrococcus yayanosii CH1]
MILIIAEKPNVARKIASALAEGRPVKKSIYGVPYYELTRDGKRLIVAPAVGHLYGLAPKRDFFGYPIFDIEWVPVYVAEKGKEYAKDYIKALSVLAKRAKEFVVATDYDTEGEVIGYTALKYACGVDPRKAKRMKFSALTKRDLLKAWYNLEPTINFGMAGAGIARHVLDWYWGVNLSRALTHAIKRASGKWVVLSTGRVQGPTLKFLVDREREIQNFVPKPYWIIKLILEKNGRKLTATYEKDKVWDEEEAKRIVQEARKGYAIVENIDVRRLQRNPPVPFDLGTLQREAYSAFGYSPKKTLDIAQSLYEKGYCLHPDSLIPTPDGIKKIAELPKEGEVLALDFNLKLSRARYRLLERDADELMYKVTLGDRTELYLTADHPVLVCRDDKLIFVPAEELKESDQVVLVIAREGFKGRENPPTLLDFLLENARTMKDYILYDPEFGKDLRRRLKERGLKVEVMAEFNIRESTYYNYLRGKMPVPIAKFLLDKGVISREELRSVFRGFAYSTSLSPISFEFSEEFWYLYGFVVGSSYTVKNGALVISAKEREEDIVRAIREVANSLGVPFRYDAKYKLIIIRSKSLTRLFELLGCSYGNKTRTFRIQGIVVSRPGWIAAFLAGYCDADAHIRVKPTGSRKSLSPQIVLTSKNKEVIYTIKLMWQLLGVRTYLLEKKDKNGVVYELKVYPKDVPRFYEVLRSFLIVKRKDLERVIEIVAGKRAINIEETAIPLTDEDLRRIATGDVYLLKVNGIEKFRYRGKVYDLVVEDYHNFIANGVVVHNCSYPRTSSQKLPKNLNFGAILQGLSKLPEYRPFAHMLLGKEVLKPVEGKKEDPAHPAIYPTGEVPKPGELTKDEQNLYDLIVRRFLALFMEPAVRESVKVTIKAGSHRFILSGARTVKEGWLRVYGKYVKFDEVLLPGFRRGEPVRVLQVKREKKKTKPPARYSPAAVIKKMEDLGLGTKATRAQILETLYQRGYIEGKKSIKVTPLGMKVVETLEKHVPEIVSVELTREFEEKMELIMNGKLTKEAVIEEAKERLLKILEEFKRKELEIGRELAKIVIGEDLVEDKREDIVVVGKCPKCGGDLVVKYNRKTGKRFVGCSNWPKCDVTYPILQRGEIIPTNKTCCDGTPIVIIREEDGREYEICLDIRCRKGKGR